MAIEVVQTTYIWQDTEKPGNKTKGEIHSSSQALVKTQLPKEEVAPTKVKRKPKDLFGPRKQKIKRARKCVHDLIRLVPISLSSFFNWWIK